MSSDSNGHIFRADEVRAGFSEGEIFSVCMRRGNWTLELYEPKHKDEQEPHKQDECYVVLEGSGVFVMGDKRVRFSPGDMIFVPAGLPHRFEEFGERMRVWVIFAGPEGGEPA